MLKTVVLHNIFVETVVHFTFQDYFINLGSFLAFNLDELVIALYIESCFE